MNNTWVISLGGSIVAPDGVDVDFLSDFYTLITEYVEHMEYRFILVVGGGAPARVYQQAYRDLVQSLHEEYGTKAQEEAQDRIGIQATHLNASIVKELFDDYACDTIVTNPEDDTIEFNKPILVGAGWKPGFSTDLDAVVLAERFDASTIINLSNIAKIYTADPHKDSNAMPLDSITWQELIDMVGDSWVPGMNAPFDPIACKKASQIGLQAFSAEGRDMDNLRHILDGKDFYGTKISH